MKDPAFLFYSSDFLSGVSDLTFEERGQYITLLCLQHQKGRLSKKMIELCCGNATADVLNKFNKDDNGLYFNKRLEIEIEKRLQYSEKQKQRAFDGWKKRRENNATASDTAYATAMPLENENEIINDSKVLNTKKRVFKKPNIDEVKQFFKEKGYTEESAIRAFNHYDIADWFNSYGKKVVNWKQTMITNWFNDTNKIKTENKERKFVC